jgi:hypothetical protein
MMALTHLRSIGSIDQIRIQDLDRSHGLQLRVVQPRDPGVAIEPTDEDEAVERVGQERHLLVDLATHTRQREFLVRPGVIVEGGGGPDEWNGRFGLDQAVAEDVAEDFGAEFWWEGEEGGVGVVLGSVMVISECVCGRAEGSYRCWRWEGTGRIEMRPSLWKVMVELGIW